MGTIRRRARTQQSGRITPEAIDAYRKGDALALSRVLRLPPWQVSPLEAFDPCPYPATCAGATTWADSVALRELLEAEA